MAAAAWRAPAPGLRFGAGLGRPYWQLYASLEPNAPDRLDALLRAVADYELVNVILADRDLNWLYHPYDGGADVYARDAAQRDRLLGKHAEWLSSHPLGL